MMDQEGFSKWWESTGREHVSGDTEAIARAGWTAAMEVIDDIIQMWPDPHDAVSGICEELELSLNTRFHKRGN